MFELERSWQFNVNNVSTGYDSLEVGQRTLFTLKDALTTFASSPWVVVGSSDGVTAGMDGVDRWTSHTALQWSLLDADMAMSWVVLKQPALASNFQMLIACRTDTLDYYGKVSIYTSRSDGFSGGNATTAPTATDQVAHRVHEPWSSNSNTAVQTVLHVWQSDDGEATRWAACSGGVVKGFSLIERAVDAPSQWADAQVVCDFGYAEDGRTTYSYYGYNPALYAKINGADCSFHMTSEGYGNYALGETFNQTANALTGEWPIFPLGLACPTPGSQGRHGRLLDLFFGSTSPTLIPGTTYPADGSRTLIQLHHMVLPWNGTVPVVS